MKENGHSAHSGTKPSGNSDWLESYELQYEEKQLAKELVQYLVDSLDGVGTLAETKIIELYNRIAISGPLFKWLAIHTIGTFLKLTEVEKDILIQKFNLSKEDEILFELDFYSSLGIERFKAGAEAKKDPASAAQWTMRPSNSVANYTLASKNGGFEHEVYMLVKSKQDELDRIKECLAEEKWKPLCVLGSTGVGKTTLVKLAASSFERFRYPDVISVQLSDQVDSRLLLGAYHSTDLPGQFVWKPGCLTKAVLSGHWVILEDLDTAPADVMTLLDSIIDSGTLTVPGYGEIKQFHESFRLISTVRTFSSTSTKKIDMRLGNRWTKVVIRDYKEQDLRILLAALFPHLKNVSSKFAAVFDVMKEANDHKGGKSRLLSLRDFLKLCKRLPVSMDLNKTTSSVKVFQEALDVFVANFFDTGARKVLAEKIGAHFNMLVSSVEHFLITHKPVISIDLNRRMLTAGRFTIPMCTGKIAPLRNLSIAPPVYSLTKTASKYLEMICGCVQQSEPVLLLGETGVGKTSSVQFLAQTLQQKLIVVNLNRQSDSADLLGGYKPVELKHVMGPLREEFETLFAMTFNRESNGKFLTHIMTQYANKEWRVLVKMMQHVLRNVTGRKKKFSDNKNLLERWSSLGFQLSRIDVQLRQGSENPFAFSFIEGSLIEAVKRGEWILLDEINLATPEMLQCLAGVLEINGIINLWEKGDDSPVFKHKDFRLFAAMNPSTDVGKRDLPMGLRNRFTEFFVDELTDPAELQILVGDYLKELSLTVNQIESLVNLYLTVRSKSLTELTDGTGKRPHFSLRTLCRGLQIAAKNLYGSVTRSIYESLCISFLTQMDHASYVKVQALILRHVFNTISSKAVINQAIPEPANGRFVCVEGFWIARGDEPYSVNENQYILTESVRRNLKDLSRIVSAGKLPVLIQGETSVGKTSLIQYFAEITGNRCYRINNHQHTDLQEYIGSYQSDDSGKLVFVEGLLVRAMRRGEWIILDELNLAPSEVLEALNRVLDDNRQLFIAETGVTVTAHPRFTLFATQNPPGLYGGRKLLSRAFRNRFIELHFDEIPTKELETILHLRCAIPPSYCKKIIGTLKELQMRRKSSAALQGKHGFATLRDLFRWAERYRLADAPSDKFYDWDQHLADEGYLVLAGKVRQMNEAEVIIEVLKKHFKRTVTPEHLFTLSETSSTVTRTLLEKVMAFSSQHYSHVVWTYTMRRLAVLIGNAMKFNEPILLVGETGCGKTTMVQILSELFGRQLYGVNCHMNSEGSDFLGGLRPIRNRVAGDDRLFEWVNGPLVDAMNTGGVFLADEISLADDSVLERINSVLEKERTLLIAEKGDEVPELIKAHQDFVFVGTMNPGGDYGKKELSPALRNRLTEIWCPVYSNEEEVEDIVEHNLCSALKGKNIGCIMTSFCRWLKQQDLCRKVVISLRDFLAWTKFINRKHGPFDLNIASAIMHGASLVFLDALGSGITSADSPATWTTLRKSAVVKLAMLTSNLDGDEALPMPDLQLSLLNEETINVIDNEDMLQIGAFQIAKEKVDRGYGRNQFAFDAPTTCRNGMRILRAMQLSKPILLEGSPGVGKTAIVTALAKSTNNDIVRINLSDQTDISDLFGADLPVEGESGGKFAWRDGPLLQALKQSAWILLDELNLASQSVLEGLNACLDHRGEIYVPELNRTFHVPPTDCRIFACQNPVRQGGARKGLPKSFLNRFTQVYIDSLELDDLHFIVRSLYPEIPECYVAVMTKFSQELQEQVSVQGKFGARGSPWDFNLRDTLRWCQLLLELRREETVVFDDLLAMGSMQSSIDPPGLFVDHIYGMRMRSAEDRQHVLDLYNSISRELEVSGGDLFMSSQAIECGQTELTILSSQVVCGNARLPRQGDNVADTSGSAWRKNLAPLPHQLAATEALLKALQMSWMPILVGPASSGKSSLIKLLARICGKDLHIMCPSPEMDTMELLGSFEQADIYRRLDEMTRNLDVLMDGVLRTWLVYHGDLMETAAKGLDYAEYLLFTNAWKAFKGLKALRPKSGRSEEDELEEIGARMNTLETCYLKCKCLLERQGFLEPGCNRDDDDDDNDASGTVPPRPTQATVRRLQENCVGVGKEMEEIWRHLRGGIQTGSFHWSHSLLIKAMIKGDWLLIDGANRCSSAVLDRLNSLVEPDGSLFLTERGAIDGKIIEIRPHPEFRLILALNPSYGEISRAMRNRGVEIYLPGAEEHKELMKRTEDGFIESNKSLISSAVVPLSPECFLTSRAYRVWTSFSVFDTLAKELSEMDHLKCLLLMNTLWRSEAEDIDESMHLLRAEVKTGKVGEYVVKLGSVKSLRKDRQFEPHFVLRFKTSRPSDLLPAAHFSWSLHRHLLIEDSKDDLKPGTVAFKARVIADGRGGVVQQELEDVMETLKCYWNVRKLLGGILAIMFEYNCWNAVEHEAGMMLQKQEVDSSDMLESLVRHHEFNMEKVAEFWLNGMQVMMLLQKLINVGQATLNVNVNNEILFGQIRVLLDRVKQRVVPWLDLIQTDRSEYGSLREEMKRALKNLSYERGRSLECGRVEKGVREACFSVDALRIGAEVEERVLGILKTVFTVWSQRSAVPRENWGAAIGSQDLYGQVVEACGELLKAENVPEGIEFVLEELLRRHRTEQMDDDGNLSISERTLKIQALVGMEEYLRLTSSSADTYSAFTNPVAAAIRNNPELARWERVEKVLGWEEERRWFSVFGQGKQGITKLQSLIPGLTATVFYGNSNGTGYIMPSLLESNEYKADFKKLTKCLQQYVFTTPLRDTTEILNELGQQFVSDMRRLERIILDTKQLTDIEGFQLKFKPLMRRVNNADLDLLGLGELMVNSAALLLEYITHLPPVDPAVESKILSKLSEDDIQYFKDWINLGRTYEEGCVGRRSDVEVCHQYFAASMTYVRNEMELLCDYKRSIADRPKNPCYSTIIKDVLAFLKSLGSKEKLQKLLEEALQALKDSATSEDKIEQLGVACDHWIEGHLTFVDKILRNFMYWDIVVPLASVSTWASTGLSILKHLLFSRSSVAQTALKAISPLTAYPSSMIEPSEVGAVAEHVEMTPQNVTRLHLCSLVDLVNVVIKQGELNGEAVKRLYNLTEAVSKCWFSQKEKSQQKETEKDALYIFKGKERLLEASEEEIEAIALKETFPTFQNEFADLIPRNMLEDSVVNGIGSPEDADHDEASVTALLPKDVMLFIRAEMRLMGYVSTYYVDTVRENDAASIDTLTPFLQRFGIGCRFFSQVGQQLDREADHKFAIGALVASLQCSKYPEIGNVFNLYQAKSVDPERTYDIYHDPNPTEVQQLRSILKSLRKRVQELLEEWAEFPSLLRINAVIDRIETFKLEDPLIKYLTGVELLVETAQEWEDNAHKGVSIASNLLEFFHVILKWRKMELSCWKNLLDISERREVENAFEWWFFVTNMAIEFVKQNELYGDETQAKLQNLSSVLNQFMETSPLGQYEARLSVIRVVFMKLVALDKYEILGCSVPMDLFSLLWNIMKYYEEFLPTVKSRLVALKQPIEKKLKDFVKICRWNDMNLSALKDSVANSQKTLMRSIREMKKVLMTPSKSLLGCDENLPSQLKMISLEEDQLKWFQSCTLNPEMMFNPLATVGDAFGRNQALKAIAESLKLDKLKRKLGKIQESCLKTSHQQFQDYFTEVKELSDAISATFKEMGDLEVKETGEARKKFLHHVHSNRRLSVADAFKRLTEIGLSFRKGIIRLKSQEATATSTYLFDFLIEPHDLQVTWKRLNHSIENILMKKANTLMSSSWVSLNSYFQKCLIKMMATMAAFESPNKQITSAILERCRGFSAELLNVVIQEKQTIAQFSRFLWLIGVGLSGQAADDKRSTRFERIRFTIAAVSLEFEQWLTLLNSCGTGDNSSYLSDTVSKILACLNNVLSNNVIWNFKEVNLVEIKLALDEAHRLGISLSFGTSLVDHQLLESINKIRDISLLVDSAKDGSIVVTGEEGPAADVITHVMLTMQKLSSFCQIERDDTKIFTLNPIVDLLEVEKMKNLLMSVLVNGKSQEDQSVLLSIVQQYKNIAQFYLTQLVHLHRGHVQLFLNMASLFTALGLKGFNLPPDYEEEAMKEGSELDAKGGMGLGDGETTSDAKDVSDRLESEDQLEDTLKPGENTESADKDVEEDDNGIDMSENFEGKHQDDKSSKKQKEGSEDEESGDEETPELDKEMGEINEPETEKLDEQLWGGSSDEEDDMDEDTEGNTGGQKLKDQEPELKSKDPETQKQGEEEEEDQSRPPEKQKESTEMDDEGEVNDDQVDPFHGQDIPEQEPEAMDLPEDLNLDDGEMKDNEPEGEEENPFDLDTEKDKTGNLDEEMEETSAEQQNVENEMQEIEKEEDADDQQEGAQQDRQQKEVMPSDEQEPVQPEEMDNSEPEDTVAKGPEIEEIPNEQEREVEADPNNTAQPDANAENKASNDDKTENQVTVEEHDQRQQDDSGKGQAESNATAGHEGSSASKTQQEADAGQNQEQQSSTDPGDKDRKRQLASELDEPSAKRLRALESKEAVVEDDASAENDAEAEQTGKEFDLYQHVTQADKFDQVTLDSANKEDAERQPVRNEGEENVEQQREEEPEEDIDSDIEMIDEENIRTEKTTKPSNSRPKKDEKSSEQLEDQNKPQESSIEGDVIATYSVRRPEHSHFVTQTELIRNQAELERDEDMDDVDDHAVSEASRVLDGKLGESLSVWHQLESETLPLAQDLCEQLRLILEPTLAARLKGDYKTGKRLNMRKVIPYVASGFRKDKIWLRRTQPSKREYQILLALDDSASMSDNQSKQMAFSAVAVVSKALGLLEAGELAVASFGEDVQVVHPFDEPFTDSSGAQLIQKFTFVQRQTRIGQLMNYVTQTFKDLKNKSHTSSALNPEVAQLALIISDGRNVSSEGKDFVAKAIRRARNENIFTIFIIVDNPQNKDSILDVRYAEFDDKNNLKQFNYYMDHFPFPFYMILRDLSNLPSVLTDALRQWFELVTSNDR